MSEDKWLSHALQSVILKGEAWLVCIHGNNKAEFTKHLKYTQQNKKVDTYYLVKLFHNILSQKDGKCHISNEREIPLLSPIRMTRNYHGRWNSCMTEHIHLTKTSSQIKNCKIVPTPCKSMGRLYKLEDLSNEEVSITVWSFRVIFFIV